MLATSGAPLRISGEAVISLPPLALEQEAVFLFADRAAAARPGFTINDGNRAAVTKVCRRLDRLPLAVELAAPLVAVMPPSELAQELDHRFEILDAGPRDADERQRSLRPSVRWSYDLLSEEERRLFRRLAVFQQAFSVEAVRDVALDAGAPPGAALRLVSHLVEKSMVTARPDEVDPRHYRLLDTLREFAGWSEEARFGSRTDIELNHAGRRDAGVLARNLESIAIDAIWSSPSARAMSTATTLASGRSADTVEVKSGLRERDFGKFEGSLRRKRWLTLKWLLNGEPGGIL